MPMEKGKTMTENYISLERAIERMYEVTEECGTERIFIDRIIDELENLPSSPNICIHPQWIPVSERLPEVGTGNVLVARSYKGKPYVDVGEFINGTACCWVDEYAINPREHITTHWMPLPEPPKEEDK